MTSRYREQRALSISAVRTTKRELRAMREENASIVEKRPATRGDCIYSERPCPFVSCKHHLFLDVNQANGSVKLNFPDIDPDELQETCTLDVAARGGATLETIAALMNLTRERTRQLEEIALRKMAAEAARLNEAF